MSVFEVILAHIFPFLEWIPKDTDYLSVFNSNAVKCGPEQLRIRTLFTQWKENHFEKLPFQLFGHTIANVKLEKHKFILPLTVTECFCETAESFLNFYKVLNHFTKTNCNH